MAQRIGPIDRPISFSCSQGHADACAAQRQEPKRGKIFREPTSKGLGIMKQLETHVARQSGRVFRQRLGPFVPPRYNTRRDAILRLIGNAKSCCQAR